MIIKLKELAKTYHDSIVKAKPTDWKRFDTLTALKNIYSNMSKSEFICDAKNLANVRFRNPKNPKEKLSIYQYLQSINDMFVHTCVRHKQVSFIIECLKLCVEWFGGFLRNFLFTFTRFHLVPAIFLTPPPIHRQILQNLRLQHQTQTIPSQPLPPQLPLHPPHQNLRKTSSHQHLRQTIRTNNQNLSLLT